MSAGIEGYRREDLDDQVNGIAYEATGEIPTIILSTGADKGALGRLRSMRVDLMASVPGLPSFLESVRRIVCDHLP
jgi:hypothetical protein